MKTYERTRRLNLWNWTLATLLSATGYQSYAQSNDNEEDVFDLSPFTVSVGADDRGYLSSNATSGTSLNTAIRDMPMALEVVNQELIEDLGAVDMAEALQFSAGVESFAYDTDNWNTGNAADFNDSSPSANVPANQGNVLTIRGYRSPNQQRFGFRIGMLVPEYGVVIGGNTNTVNTERMEVVRGPNSLLYGVNMLTGVVNIIPKTPSSKKHTQVGLTVGSNSLIRATMDTTGPLWEDNHKWGQLNYRAMLSYKENDGLRQFSRNDESYFAGQLDYWSPNNKFNLFVEYQYADSTFRGIGFNWYTLPVQQYLRDEFGEPLIPTRNYDPNSPDYQIMAEPGAMPHEIKDYGYYQNISGPDTWRKTEEKNFLVLARLNPIEGLHIEGGLYYSENDVETRNVRSIQIQRRLQTASFFDLRYADAFPEYDPNDTLTRATADAVHLNGAPLAANVLDGAFSITTDNNLSNGGYGFMDIVAVEYPGDSSRYDPAGNNGAEINRYGAQYAWYQWPQTSESMQARLRAVYEFDTSWFDDRFRASHTIVAGVNYIKDEIAFVQNPMFGQSHLFQEAWGEWDGVSSTPTAPRFDQDAVYYRDSVFNPNPIRFTSDTVLGVEGQPSKNRLGNNTTDEQGNTRLINWVTRSGHKEVTMEFTSANLIYQGKFLNDRLLVFGGIRHDEYEKQEREKLRVVDWTGATGTAFGKPLTSSVYPLTRHLIGDGSGPYTPIPALDISSMESGQSRTINEAVAADIATIQEVYPDGTFEREPKQSFTTPSFGVSYKVWDPLTVYYSHSEGIFPNAGQRDGNYDEIAAEQSTSDEIGIKFDLLDGKISGTLSFFKIKRENATYRLAVAPNPAGWHGGENHSGNPNSVAFDPASYAGYNGVPLDAETGRSIWPVKWDQLVEFPKRGPPPEGISEVTARAMGLNSVFLEKFLEERDIAVESIRSENHPVTGKKLSNAPSGFLNNYGGGDIGGGDFYTTHIRTSYVFDMDILEEPPHEDPDVEALRNIVREAFEEAYNNQDERLPDNIVYLPPTNRIQNMQNSSQAEGSPYVTYEEEGKGFDGQIIFSPTANYQIIFNFSHIERQIVGKGFNMVRPIDQWGNDWATGWDVWNWALGRENFTDPKDPTTFTGEGVNGIDISFVPQDTLALWNKYQFTEGRLRNLEIFGGVTWKGAAETSTSIGGANARANYFRTPPTSERYEVTAGFGYRFDWKGIRWNLRLNISNLLDDTYDATYITYNEVDPFTGAEFTETRRWERYYPGRGYRLSLSAKF
jgi:outer membrane receptor for ferric coprogen and ferric-rhodotorulic acid